MIKVLFVCHGNICRSVMAEYIMKFLVAERGLEAMFYIDSCAVSREEIGNRIYYLAEEKLNKEGIPVGNHKARQITMDDYHNFDYIIAMDESNINSLSHLTNGDQDNKCTKLLNFVGSDRDISDPWWNDDFDTAYNDIVMGIEGLISRLNN